MQERSIQVNGAIVFWNAGPTQRELLEHRLTELGLERFAPRLRTDSAALKAAMQDYCVSQLQNGKGSPDRRIEGHKSQKDHGFEAVEIQRGEDENSYYSAFSARVSEDGEIRVTKGFADKYVLQELYRKAKFVVTGPGVGKSLVDLLAYLGGTALRPSGGIYWIPESGVNLWERVATAVEGCSDSGSKNSVYLVRTLMDQGTVKAVRDAIIAEIEATATAIAEELREGLGDEAIEHRKELAGELHTRITMYESILGEGLARLHTVVGTVEQSMTLAALQTL
jgi:hypothetical protein